jgi:CHAD domain-containing protein
MGKAKEIEGLSCDGRAADDIRRVLCARLGEMCERRAEALEWSDPEGVHDMRVASRRLRSAVRDFKPYLRQRKLANVADELKRVADALGAVRDEDVAIMALEELQREAPVEMRAGIARLADERRVVRDAARATLVAAIEKEKLEGLQAAFAAALERAMELRRPRRKRKSPADRSSLSEIGRKIIGARLEELRDLSACLYQPLEADALHRMRIAAKRLRYAMELFAACLGQGLTEQAKDVAELQTSLGELHDCDVWLESFGQMLRDFQEQQDKDGAAAVEATGQKRSAAVWLLRHFAKARMKHFGQALARWHKWETTDFLPQLVASLDAARRNDERGTRNAE